MTNPYSGLTAFVASGVLGATDMNDFIMNNIGHVKSPPFAQVFTAANTIPSTTATTGVPVTAGISATLTTYGAPVHVVFRMATFTSGGGVAYYNLLVDGTAHSSRAWGMGYSLANINAFFDTWITGLATGSHTFVPTWFVNVGTAYAQISAQPVEFWVREG